jgi:hypothetical protein
MTPTTTKQSMTLDEFLRWLNEWGDIDQYQALKTHEWRAGYQQAIREAYDLFAPTMTDLRSHEPPRTEPGELEQDQPASDDES